MVCFQANCPSRGQQAAPGARARLPPLRGSATGRLAPNAPLQQPFFVEPAVARGAPLGQSCCRAWARAVCSRRNSSMSFAEVSSPSHTTKDLPWDITRLFGTPRFDSQLMNSSSWRSSPSETLRPVGKGSPITARTTLSAASLSFGTHEIHSLPSSLFSTRCGTPDASSPRFSASCVCESEYVTARVPTGGSPNDRGRRSGSPASPTRSVL